MYMQPKPAITPAEIRHRLSWLNWKQIYPDANECFCKILEYLAVGSPESFAKCRRVYREVALEISGHEVPK